jgi:hypothetical protein
MVMMILRALSTPGSTRPRLHWSLPGTGKEQLPWFGTS